MSEFNFQQQKTVGEQGVQWLLDNYHRPPLTLLSAKNLTGDVKREDDGKIIEVKTDTYPLVRSTNFFFELYSNAGKKTPGGPWRAFEQGTDIFLYLYWADKIYFECDDVRELLYSITDLVKNPKQFPLVGVANRLYTTLGYKIPRSYVAHCFTQHEVV